MGLGRWNCCVVVVLVGAPGLFLPIVWWFLSRDVPGDPGIPNSLTFIRRMNPDDFRSFFFVVFVLVCRMNPDESYACKVAVR